VARKSTEESYTVVNSLNEIILLRSNLAIAGENSQPSAAPAMVYP